MQPRTRQILSYSATALAATILTVALVVVIISWRLSKRVDSQLASGPLAGTYNFYAAPESIVTGDGVSPAEAADELRQSGFRESPDGGAGTFSTGLQTLTIYPRSGEQPVTVAFKKDSVGAIRQGNQALEEYDPGPVLITNISDSRDRRMAVRFSDLPPVLVHAVISAEDKRFFEHSGLDPLRIAKAALVDVRDRRKEQGASTITMQLARNLYLDRDKNWRRKFAEILISVHLERTMSKREIFEYYANQVYLGRDGTFGVAGFGLASHTYFNKDVSRLNLPEAALLAGLIQRPSSYDPFRYPERALDRRNLVLTMMRQNKYITPSEYEEAVAAPLGLVRGVGRVGSSQYFLDLAADRAQKDLGEDVHPPAADVHTTIDLRLQRAAEKAVADGMKLVDDKIRARWKKKGENHGLPQVALIAIDPRTGAIRALVGGRDYSTSQLDRALARRPPGSVFKPFVYAAALQTAISGGNQVYSPASMVDDSPTTFRFANQVYSPDDFRHEFHGSITFRKALSVSANVAAVKVGQMIGLDNVIALARRAGIADDLQPTPALALGAYGISPLEIAGAYTVFANNGTYVAPTLISSVDARNGEQLYRASPDFRNALDPRVNYLMLTMLQDVVTHGTAASVRSSGFILPAAGKTGTARDGWFAGFTSQLLCVVWVGFDDYHDLDLEGAHSALPIWTEFMQQAAHYSPYREGKPFAQPPGVVKATVDPTTGMLAGPYCPWSVSDWYVDGTQPDQTCDQHTEETMQAEQVNPDGTPRPITVDAHGVPSAVGEADRQVVHDSQQ